MLKLLTFTGSELSIFSDECLWSSRWCYKNKMPASFLTVPLSLKITAVTRKVLSYYNYMYLGVSKIVNRLMLEKRLIFIVGLILGCHFCRI